jgi:hypothetical protein
MRVTCRSIYRAGGAERKAESGKRKAIEYDLSKGILARCLN